jgi:hypothetical protein
MTARDPKLRLALSEMPPRSCQPPQSEKLGGLMRRGYRLWELQLARVRTRPLPFGGSLSSRMSGRRPIARDARFRFHSHLHLATGATGHDACTTRGYWVWLWPNWPLIHQQKQKPKVVLNYCPFPAPRTLHPAPRSSSRFPVFICLYRRPQPPHSQHPAPIHSSGTPGPGPRGHPSPHTPPPPPTTRIPHVTGPHKT